MKSVKASILTFSEIDKYNLTSCKTLIWTEITFNITVIAMILIDTFELYSHVENCE